MADTGEIAGKKFEKEIKQLYLKTDSEYYGKLHEYLKNAGKEIVYPNQVDMKDKNILFRITKQYIRQALREKHNIITNFLTKLIASDERMFYDDFFCTSLFKDFIVASLPMFKDIDFKIESRYFLYAGWTGSSYKDYGIIHFKNSQIRDLLGDDHFYAFYLPIIKFDDENDAYYFMIPAAFIPQ